MFALGIILTGACLGLAVTASASESPSLALPSIVRQTMALWFESTASREKAITQLAEKLPPMRQYAGPRGVFVTLSHAGKTRACWGSVFPQYKNVREAAVYTTVDALTKEYRHKPVSKTEWRTLKPQVTVVTAMQRIERENELNPLRDGLMMRAGSRSCVILPGEARDAHYQTVLCRLKAGLRPTDAAQLYRIKADVYQ